jgi:hypothetical protein
MMGEYKETIERRFAVIRNSRFLWTSIWNLAYLITSQ